MSYLEDNNIKAVAFDIDGTLYPKSETNRILVKTSLLHLPFALKYLSMRKVIREEDGYGDLPYMSSNEFKKREMDIMFPKGNKDLEWFKEKERRVFHDKWEKEFLSVKPFDGMKDFMKELKKRVPIALLSDFPIGTKLKAFEIENIANFVLSSEDIGRLKPAKSPFRLISESLNLLPSEILYVGDSEKKDVIGSKKAGMHSALIAKKGTISEADIVVSSFYELAKVLL